MNAKPSEKGNEQGWSFCPVCGGPLTMKVPVGDDHVRMVCDACERIYYENPKVIVGTLPVYEGKILLCRRAIEPRKGYWTLPSGFMENHESAEEGAARETWEEARGRVNIRRLHTVFCLPHIHQVYLLYLAELIDGKFEPGPESLECRLVPPSEIPWDDLAFRAVEFALRNFDVEHNEGIHRGEYRRARKGPWTLADQV